MTNSTPEADPGAPMPPSRSTDTNAPLARLAAAHLRFGWWALFAFLLLGLVLEGLHSLKLGFYLDHSNETRRLLWTLAHAHGTLLALVHIAFALSLPRLVPTRIGDHAAKASSELQLASRCLYAGAVALPLGFFLGGVFVYEGDPGLAVVLAPIGGLLVAFAVLLIARATKHSN